MADGGRTPEQEGEWAPFLGRLERERAFASTMGGDERVRRQRDRGRDDVRSRVAALCDPGSFAEIAALAGIAEPDGPVAADGFVGGRATIDGRAVCVGAEDFTVQGGSIGFAGMTKRERIARLARDEGAPLVSLLEGSGARVGKMLERYVPVPTDLTTLADLSGLVPTVAVVMGPSAGHGALTAAMADFVVMVRGTSSIFTAGPPLVKAALGEDVGPEELGGAAVQCDVSGVAQLAVASEEDAFDAVRRYLSYFPSNAWLRPPHAGPDEGNPDVGERRVDELLDIIPPNSRRPYDVTDVIATVFDAGSVLEVSPTFAQSIVTALGRLGGHAVAIVANQPRVGAGAVDAPAADKAARFLGIAGSFHLPVVFLADNPGVLAGSQSERQGILRASARMFAAQHRLTSPKLHVTLRKAFGFGSPIMGMNQFDGRSHLFALPSSTLAAMPARGGADIAKSDAAAREELESTQAAGPWKMASEAVYDDVIQPGELRDALRSVLGFLADPGRVRPVAPVARVGHQP